MKAATYFTGKPCKRGHIAARFVSVGVCVDCNRENASQRRKDDPVGTRAAVVWAHAMHGEDYRAGHQAANTRWRLEHPEATRTIRQRSFAKLGAAYWRTARAKRRAAEKRQVPVWADADAISRIYARCPIGHHVDHVIPLRGRLVSGLHVENNLQYLPAAVNQRKHNSFEVI